MATSLFTPQGGMNQDDSMITPTTDSAGKNAFELGDYKYALNARIGSSRSDNFGDLENIKGTTEVTDYYVRAQIANNSNFSGGLTGWSQTGLGADSWAVVGSDVLLTSAGDFASKILYQAVSPAQRRIGIHVDLTVDILTARSSGNIIFLHGTTVLSTRNIINDVNSGTATPNRYSKYLNIILPVTCDGIGFQISGIASLGTTIKISKLEFFNWIAGTRPLGGEQVVGKLENKEFNILMYYVYNSLGNHCIRYYDPSTPGVYELLQWSGLNFNPAYFVSNAMIDNYFGFTDRFNAPRLADFYTISDLFLIIGAPDFSEYHVAFHKWAPVMPPTLKIYYDGSTNNYKKFENKLIQVSYRYIYNGRLKSRWSPDSAVAQNFPITPGNQITALRIDIPGFTFDVPGALVAYNYFSHDDIKFYNNVEFIEIGYREGPIDVWRILKRYSVKAQNNKTFLFTGDSNSAPIPTTDFDQLFDTVPFLAGTIEAIDNRFVFGDCLDELDVAPPVEVTNVGVVKFDASQTLNNWWSAGTNNSADNALLYTGMSGTDADEIGFRNAINYTTFKGRGLYKLAIQWLHRSGWRSAGYTDDSFMFTIPEETGIVDKLYALTFKFPSTFIPPDWAVGYQIMRTNCLNIADFLFGAVNSFAGLIDDTTATVENVQVPQDIRDRIRQHFENAHLAAGQKISEYDVILDNKSYYKSIVSDVRKTTNAATIAVASRLFIDMNNWYNSSFGNAGKTSNNPMNKLFYNFKQGDRIRFLASTNATPSQGQKVVYDVPILEFTGRAVIIEKPLNIVWLPGATGTIASDYMIEVYTPKIPIADDYIYYETGEWYPVLYPGTAQRDMSKRDWTFTNTAAMTCSTYGDVKIFNKRPMSFGDCHSISKTLYFDYQSVPATAVSTNVFTASMRPNPNEAFDVWQQNNGRASLAYTDLPIAEFKTTQVRFGGQKIELSFVNQINRFRDEDQKIYPSEYGRIRALVNTANAQVESVGSILLAIGERESFSIYVNRATLESLNGDTQVTLSDKVLGSFNTLLGSHGTLNPESVCVDRGRVYFWDANDGSWVRYGRDGLTEVSYNKMRNWFRGIGELLINTYHTSTPPLIIADFDSYNQELVIFMNHSTLPSTYNGYDTYKGAMFSEIDTRWKSIHSYAPERFARLKNKFISFKNGSLFIHESNSAYSTFYSTKYDVEIEPVANILPKDMKSHQYIRVTSTHGWSVERFLSEYRGGKSKQQSSLALTSFEEKEDHFYSAILNDANTPNESNGIITGDKMRSKALRMLMKMDPAVVTLSLLHYVEVGEIDSPKNT